MKIELGKFYRTRDGKKVRIYAMDGSRPFIVHGAYFSDSVVYGWQWEKATWKSDGTFAFSRPDPKDLVDEWDEREDPEKK